MDSFWHDVLEDERELCAYTLAWLARTSHMSDFSHLDIFLPSDNKNVGRKCFHSRVLVFTGGGVGVYGVCLVQVPSREVGMSCPRSLLGVPMPCPRSLWGTPPARYTPLGRYIALEHPPERYTPSGRYTNLGRDTHQQGTLPRRYTPVLTSSGGHWSGLDASYWNAFLLF